MTANHVQRRIRACILVLVAAFIGSSVAASAARAESEAAVKVAIPVGALHVTDDAGAARVTIDGFGRLPTPGVPNLPSRVFAIAIPPGAEVVDVTYETADAIVQPGRLHIDPAPLPRSLGEEDPAVLAKRVAAYDAQKAAVYGSDDPFPAKVAEIERTAGYREYDLVDVRVTPVAYRPVSGELAYYPEVTAYVHYRLPSLRRAVSTDRLARTEQVAADIILNHADVSQWYGQATLRSRGLHDFVIITLDSLTSAITPLVNWETQEGRTVQVVTTTWINSNYTGYDLAAKMRAFLREKYPAEQWGIEDVLLVGGYDDVPMRRTAQDLGYGQPETDFYYAELSQPDSSSWDADGDHQYGENTDPIDFYAEVNVGRIPWSDTATVQSICQKSVAYEQNVDPAFKKNMLLLGGFFWNNDPNPRTDNAVLMEAKIDQPWMSDWTFTRMYEQNADCWSTYPCDYPLLHSNVMAVWPTGKFAFVNWAGHGSETSAHILGLGAPAFIMATDRNALNDSYPAIIFADACSNSDTDAANLGQAMMRGGAVAFVGATKVAFGRPGWTGPADGSTQSLDYYFTTGVTSCDYTVGQAHQRALRQMYVSGLWSYVRYETFEWGALWGNPDLGMAEPQTLTIALPDGVPARLTPGEPAAITVQINENADQYVLGSGQLHYRYAGGAYSTVSLSPLGGNLYQAVLPAACCSDVPEFYFSAVGVEAGTVYSPPTAPASVYGAPVGEFVTVFDDDFETDQGWTVDAGATTGNWERADPQQVTNGSVITQPEDDHTADGTMCYVTGPLAGSSATAYDVDRGPTRLTSPLLAPDGLDPYVSYWRWYYIGSTLDDQLVVEVSNNNGASWVTVESIARSQQWTYAEWKISDYVTPTDQVRVRFTVDDTPVNSLVEALIDDFSVLDFVCQSSEGDGDCDHDGDIDLCDFAAVQRCFDATPMPSECQPADLDGSGGVDINDVSLFTTALQGPGEP